MIFIVNKSILALEGGLGGPKWSQRRDSNIPKVEKETAEAPANVKETKMTNKNFFYIPNELMSFKAM